MRLRLRIDSAREGGHARTTVFAPEEHGALLGTLTLNSAGLAGLVLDMEDLILRFDDDALEPTAPRDRVVASGDTIEIELQGIKVVRRDGMAVG